MHVLKNYTYITLGACHSRMRDYMYVHNSKSCEFAAIGKSDSKAATSRIQQSCPCLHLDNDINEAIRPPSSPDAGQLI